MDDDTTMSSSDKGRGGHSNPSNLYDLERLIKEQERRIKEQDINFCELTASHKELKDGIIGTLKEPGLIAMIRQTHDTVMEVKRNQDSIKKDVDSLKETKLRIVGLLMGAALSSSGATVAAMKWIGHL